MIKINPKLIGTVIGPGGKMINKIIEETGAQIDINDDGSVSVSSEDPEGLKKAIEWIKALTLEPEPGQEYDGTVVRIMDFGAFVQIAPGKDGLIHISELAPYRVDKVEDVVHMGDKVHVTVIKIDEQGRINLSRKAVLSDEERQKEIAEHGGNDNNSSDQAPREPRPERRDRGDRPNRSHVDNQAEWIKRRR